MALSEMELSMGSRRLLKDREVYIAVEKPQPKLFYTQNEITNMMLTAPPDNLNSERSIETPAGIWHMEEGIAIFDSKSKEELEKVILPDRSLRKRLSKAAAVIFQMS